MLNHVVEVVRQAVAYRCGLAPIYLIYATTRDAALLDMDAARMLEEWRTQGGSMLKKTKTELRVEPPRSVARAATSGIGASSPLPCVPAKVP
jgi:hypothetical protein